MFYTQSTVADIWNCAVSIVSCYWADLWTHVIAIYFIWCIIWINIICVLAENRSLYIMHQNRMPTVQVVLHTGNFLGFFPGWGVLTVLYYKTVLKCTAHKRTYTAESMEEVIHLMKDEGLSMYTVSKQYHIWWNGLKDYTKKVSGAS